MGPRSAAGWVLVLAVALGVGCGGGDNDTSSTSTTTEAGKPVLEKFAELTEPVYVTEPPDGDGTLYGVERGGTVRSISSDGEVGPEPFIDVSDRITTEGEGGMLSMAFAPDYAKSGHVYVAYAGDDKHTHVDEFTAKPGAETADPDSRREVLAIPHPNFIHWGGLLTFGPDGRLYMGTGDGGPPYPIPDTAQDPESLLGKLLRIDPRSGDAEVVAMGLRNPWRYSFDSKNGELWIGDVGDFTQEVDHVTAKQMEGANFGWPDLEGTAQTKSDVKAPGSIPPVITYERSGKPDDPVCAVTGGYVSRDPELPSLDGQYLYADFCEGKILSYTPGSKEKAGKPTGMVAPRLSSFGQDDRGRTYVVTLDGPIYRIVPG